MRSSRFKLIFAVFLAAFIAASVPVESSEELVPPGGVVDGYLALGDFGTNEFLSIGLTGPAGGNMILLEGNTVTADDSIVITTDVAWKLTVEDANAATSNYDGKMRKGTLSGETWNYADPQVALTNGFAVLVENIGGNGNDGDKFTDVNDTENLSNPVDIVTDSSTESSPKTLDLRYSQYAVSGDGGGKYRIDLIYTLSST